MEVILWLVIVAGLIGIELATLALTTIWFAGGAAAAALAAALGARYLVQILVFLVVSLVLLLSLRPFACGFRQRKGTKTNVEEIPGQTALVTEAVDNLKETGAVQLKGLTWTARTEEDGITIPAGVPVEVIRVDGVKVIVKEKEKEEKA